MASRGVNKVILVGNLGNDPDVRFSPNGSAIASLSLATSESWNDRNTGQQVEKTEWHRVVIFGKLAEIAQQYLRKGSKVYIEGKLQTRKWQGQDGQDRYTTEVVVDGFGGQMQMLDSRGEGAQPAGQWQQNQAPQNNAYQNNTQQPYNNQYGQPQAQQADNQQNHYNQQPQNYTQPNYQAPQSAPPQSAPIPAQAPQQPAQPQKPEEQHNDMAFDDDIPF